MCDRADDPTQHDVPTFRFYDVTYALNHPRFATRCVRVLAEDADDARRKAKEQDPLFLSTTRTPRIVR